MSKELPYFKFNVSEWLLGRISDENYRVQGLFLSACCHYWHKECVVTTKELSKKLGKTNVKLLVDRFFIEEENNQISIPFLNEQRLQLSDLQIKRSLAGRKGGEASVKQRLSKGEAKVNHIDKDKIIEYKDKIDWSKLLSKFNDITGKSSRVVPDKARNQILARIKEGYTKADIIKGIEGCYKDSYHKETNHKYLTLEFISRPDKLEKFVSVTPIAQKKAPQYKDDWR